jgi:hypothetical protein
MANSKGRTLGAWGAHRKPVVQMARGGDFVFSLGANGGIRGWHVASPSPFDIVMYSELSAKAGDFTRQRLIRYVSFFIVQKVSHCSCFFPMPPVGYAKNKGF